MAAPKGNKFAKGSGEGRPPEWDRMAVAQALIEWAKKPTSINLCGFCTTHDPLIPPSNISKWARECDDFRRAYETAKAFLGHRREQMLNEDLLHVKAYDLNATTYDYFLKEEKRDSMQYESSLRVKEIAAGTEEERLKKDAIIEQIDKCHSELSSETKP